jgi:hypothetical protein
MAPGAFQIPTRHTISRETWRASAIAGGLRVRANNARRRDRDRGVMRNIWNDTAGFLAELLAVKLLLVERLNNR